MNCALCVQMTAEWPQEKSKYTRYGTRFIQQGSYYLRRANILTREGELSLSGVAAVL